MAAHRWHPLVSLEEALIPKGVWPLLKGGDTQVVALGKARGFPVYVAMRVSPEDMRGRVAAQGAEAVRGFFARVLDWDAYKRNPLAVPDPLLTGGRFASKDEILSAVEQAATDIQSLGFPIKMTWPIVITDTSGEYNFNTGDMGTGGHFNKQERMLVVGRAAAPYMREVIVHEWAHYFHEKGMSAEQKKAWWIFYVKALQRNFPTDRTYRNQDLADIPSRDEAMRLGMGKLEGTITYAQWELDRWQATRVTGLDQWLPKDHEWMDRAIAAGAVFVGRLAKTDSMVAADWKPWQGGTLDIRKGTLILIRKPTKEELDSGTNRFLIQPEMNPYTFTVLGGKNKGAWHLCDFYSLGRVHLDRDLTLAHKDNQGVQLPRLDPADLGTSTAGATNPYEAIGRYWKVGGNALYEFQAPAHDQLDALRDTDKFKMWVWGQEGINPFRTFPSVMRVEQGLDLGATFQESLRAALEPATGHVDFRKVVYGAIFPLVDPHIRAQWSSEGSLIGPAWEGLRQMLKSRGVTPSAYAASNDHELFAEVVTYLAKADPKMQGQVSPEMRKAFRKVLAGRTDF
jgi:hypothetical protein